MFDEYEVVQLVHDLASTGVRAGTRGTIVMVYPSDPPEYEVEFMDFEGNTLAVETVRADQIAKVQ